MEITLNRLDTAALTQQHMQLVEDAVVERALAAGELRIHHQPKLDLRRRLIVGTEALLRWEHPEHGLLPPSVFGDNLNDRHDDLSLIDWMFREALHHGEHWKRYGKLLTVSINIIPQELFHPQFPKLVRETIAMSRRLGLPNIELELVECGPLVDIDRASMVIDECEHLGVAVALDDFGTRYSTLTLLQRLPASIIKIDQSFIHGIVTSGVDWHVVDWLLKLAKALDKQVIAEGVENEAYGRQLATMGCHLLQGYGIARAMPFEEIVPWIHASEREGSWWTTYMTKTAGSPAEESELTPRQQRTQ